MIARNGIRSTLRARGRTVLFTLLILALTLVLTLGLGLWAYSVQVLQQCDETYTSIALVEYLGEDYPDTDAADQSAREAAAQLDGEAIAAIDGIQLWEPADQTLAWTEGYTRIQDAAPYGDYAVLDCFQLIEDTRTVWISVAPEELPDHYVSINNYSWTCLVKSEDLTVEEMPLYLYNKQTDFYYRRGYDDELGYITYTTIEKRDLPEVYFYIPAFEETLFLCDHGEVRTISDALPVFYADDAAATVYRIAQEHRFYYASISSALYASGLYATMIVVEPEDTGFVPERGQHYLLHGVFTDTYRGNKTLLLTDFYEGCETPPYYKLSDGEPPSLFQEYADFYQMSNNFIRLEASRDVASLEVFQQNILPLREGRFPEPGEEGVCVVSGNLANRVGLSLGDSLPLTLLCSSAENRFLVESSGETREWTIVGITKESNDYDGSVWASGGGFGEPLFGYGLGRAVLDNAKGRQAADALQAAVPDNVRVTLYDQGYYAAAQPLEAMRTTAMAVTIAAACGALVVLILFAYLFVGRQRETVLVLSSLGTPSGKIRLWLLSGAALVAGLAALLGAAAGKLSLGRVIQMALTLARRLYSTDQRYSEASLGVTREVSMDAAAPLWPAVLAGISVLAAALVLCLFFLSLTRREAAPKRGKMKVRTPKSGTSVAGRGAFRFAMLSAKRGGWRSFVVPAAALVLSLFLGILAANAQSWDSQRERLYRDADLTGQAVSINGRVYTDLNIPVSTARLLWKSGLLEDIAVSASWRYWVNDAAPSFSDSAFGGEDRSNWLAEQPTLIAANSLSAADGFYYDDMPEIDWLEGWDASFLADPSYAPFWTDFQYNLKYASWQYAGSEPRCYPVLASHSFLNVYGLALGDSVTVSFSFEISSKDTFSIPVTLTVVGAYTQTENAKLYVPLSFFIGPDWITGEEDMEPIDSRVRPDYQDAAVREQFFYTYAKLDTCRFTLASAGQLELFRQYLAQEKFSAVGRTASNRTTILLRDQTFTETLGALNRYIAFGQLLFPALFLLVCVLGFIVSWLMVNGRRMEFAIMRGVGAGKGRVFLSFFLEQALLCLTGCVLGGAALTLGGAGAVGWLAVGGFLACYLLGCALSVAAVGRTNLMSLLSERE